MVQAALHSWPMRSISPRLTAVIHEKFAYVFCSHLWRITIVSNLLLVFSATGGMACLAVGNIALARGSTGSWMALWHSGFSSVGHFIYAVHRDFLHCDAYFCLGERAKRQSDSRFICSS